MADLWPVQSSWTEITRTVVEALTKQTRRTLSPGSVPVRLDSLVFDMTDWTAKVASGAIMTIRLEQAVDGVNYRVVDRIIYTADDELMPQFFNLVFGVNPLRITLEPDTVVSASATIKVNLVTTGPVVEA